MNEVERKSLGHELLTYATEICYKLMPAGGDVVGRRWIWAGKIDEKDCNIQVDLDSGKWNDRSNDVSGQDLISLWGTFLQKPDEVAYEELLESLKNKRFRLWDVGQKPVIEKADRIVCDPPEGAYTDLFHRGLGHPTARYCWRNPQGAPVWYTAKYQPDLTKPPEIRPWTWDALTWGFKCAQYPRPRMLYDIHRVVKAPMEDTIVVVDNEEAAEAAKQIFGAKPVVTTWAHGLRGLHETSWEPMAGRRVLIWPSADEFGLKAANLVSNELIKLKCQVRVINPDKNSGWNAVDASNERWQWGNFRDWAKPLINVFQVTVAVPDKITVVSGDTQAETRSAIGTWEEWGLAMNKNGIPKMNNANIVRCLENIAKYHKHVWWDTFHGRLLTDIHGETRPWSDEDTSELTTLLQRGYNLQDVNEYLLANGVKAYGLDYKRNEVVDWLKSLEWDGKPRINTFFSSCMGVEEDEYASKVAQNFWIGLVARAVRPGCKMDHMVILEGVEGIRKSMAFDIIGGPWFGEIDAAVGTKDFYQDIQGKLLVEIVELASFDKAESRSIKGMLTKRKDTYRASYGRFPNDRPRQCVFVGTTNHSVYLKDNTGNRRFWPIRVETINSDWLTENRSQLYAEAFVRQREGERWDEIPIELARAHQMRVRRSDPWETSIINYLRGKSRVTTEEIITTAIKMPLENADARAQIRVDSVMELLRWIRAPAEEHGSHVWLRAGVQKQLPQMAEQAEAPF